MKTPSIVHLADVLTNTALLAALHRFPARHFLTLPLLLGCGLCLSRGDAPAIPITPPSQATLLFSTDTDSLPAVGTATGPWSQYLPSGGPAFAPIGVPTVQQFGGVKWAKTNRFNDGSYYPGDGYQVGQYAAAIPCSGVSLVMAVKPIRNTQADDWNSVVDIFYNRLVLGLGNTDGRVKIIRNATITQLPSSTAIPDGQVTILSLVVQASGTFKVYANGSLIHSEATTSPMTSLDPRWNSGNTGFWSSITLGRNLPDSWSAYNGLLGDTFVYTSALSDADRQMLEGALTAKFITNATLGYTITASAGTNGSISPNGAIPVLQGDDKTFVITPGTNSVIDDVLVDGVSVGAVTSYSFPNVQADHTIAVTFVAFPDQTIAASAGSNGTINPSGIVTVSPGGTDKTFTFTPNMGYKVADVVVDGASLGEKYSYTFTRVTDSTHTIAVTFAPLGRNIPRADQLLFSGVTESFAASEPGATGNWASYVPAGRTFTAIGTPTAPPWSKHWGGVKWAKNDRGEWDGYRVGQYSSAIPCSGASIVVAVKPTRNTNVDSWNSVVDLFYNRLVLALGNSDGRLWIMRNGLTTQLPAATAIPDGQITILSLVVQANGTYTVYANGSQIYSDASTTAMTSLDPTWNGGVPGFWSYANIGRNNPDPWSTFNGHIGDVFVYTCALSNSDRQSLEADLIAKFITNATLSCTITASAGGNGSISPSGAIQVLQGADKTFTLTPGTGSVVGDVLIDGVSVGPLTSYKFTNVQADHTIAATFVAFPDQTIAASAGANGTITPSGIVTVSPGGSDKTFTIAPDPGYKVANVMVDGASQGEKYSYTFTRVSNSLHTIAVTFAPLGRSIPRTNQLLFSAVTESFAGNEPSATGNWASYVPGGQTFTAIGTPTVKQFNGVKWEKNDYADGDGYRVGQYTAAIPCNGASIVVAVKPTRNGIGSDFQWNSVTDIFYNRLVLGISNVDGRVRVMRNGIDTQLPAETAIPDGQATILSLVVQPDGTYKVYANGNEIHSNTATSAMTSLDPKWQGGATGYWSYINIGRNNPDFWSIFNGHIGDVFVYTSALPNTDRQMLEADLMAKFITNTPGTNILSFGLPGNPAVIDQLAQTISLKVPAGTDVTTLAPTYTISPLATGNPASGTARDFTTPQTYTITAGNGTTTKDYTVKVIVSHGLQVKTFDNLYGSYYLEPIANLMALSPSSTSTQVDNIDYGDFVGAFPGLTDSNTFAILWEGWFDVSKDGPGAYTFGTSSDDGSVIYLDLNGDGDFTDPGEMIVNINFNHNLWNRTATVTLSMDSVRIAIGYYQYDTDSAMAARFKKGSGMAYEALNPINGTSGHFSTAQPSASPSAASVWNFGLPGYPAVINGTNIAWALPPGTNLTSLAPTFMISSGASATPPSGTVRDFTTPQAYKVTASDGSVKNYTVAARISVSDGLTVKTFDGIYGAYYLAPIANLMAVPPSGTFKQFGTVEVPQGNVAASFPGLTDDDTFSILWEGWFDVSKDGLGSYTFGTESDDGSMIYLDLNGDGDFSDPGEMIVSNNSDHAPTIQTNTITLDRDAVRIAIGYYEGGAIQTLAARFKNGSGLAFGSLNAITGSSGHFFSAPPPANPAAANLWNFGLPGNPAVIDQTLKTIALTVPSGTDVTALTPTFTMSVGATCNNVSGAAYDFTNPVHYIVTSSNSVTIADYKVTVTVPMLLPTVTTGAASGVTANSATLNGTVNPNGYATTARFEYGLTPGYGSTTGVTLAPSNGTTAQDVSVTISGLQTKQIYHYRLIATNSGGTTTSADMTFALVGTPPVPNGFARIPAGSSSMGDPFNEGDADEVPVHTVQLSAFYMANLEVTKALWDEVRTWGSSHGYTDLASGWGKEATHPVLAVSWYDVVKWCNARSEMEGLPPCYKVSGVVYRTGTIDAVDCNWNVNGYRLPTESEWEKAARDGLNGRRFGWGDTITHSQANYYSDGGYSYDVSPTRGFHSAYNDESPPYTSPVGSFAASNYGLYDMTGNVFEWCWDWYGGYASSTQVNPRGATSGSWRVLKGGSWQSGAYFCRTAYRSATYPSNAPLEYGFRVARGAVPAPLVTTSAADGVTEVAATFRGTVNPNGYATTAQFQYGLTTAYGRTANVTLVPNNNSVSQNVSANISGLQTGTIYHYRLTATNSSGTSMTEDMTFETFKLGEYVPRIGVEQPEGSDLTGGSSTVNFGMCITGNTVPLTFVIRNTGFAPLSGVTVTPAGANASDYVLTSAPTTSVVAGGSTSFVVTFTPLVLGTRLATLRITSNDANNNPVDIALTGQSKPVPDLSDGYIWEEWQLLHPLVGKNQPGDNPDGDYHVNLIDYAFNLPPDCGEGTPFCLKPSASPTSRVEFTFMRPVGATANLTYYLEYSRSLGDAVSWISMPLDKIAPANIVIGPAAFPNMESVTIRNLEAREGFVRLRTELDSDGDHVTDHISRTGMQGWTETAMQAGTRTYNNPYQNGAVFSGTVDSNNGVSAQTLDFTTSAGSTDLATLLTPGVAYYLEVISGDNEGHRFDVVSATGSTVTLALDNDLFAATPPFNTLAGALPANLAGDRAAIRMHWTLGDIFPVNRFFAASAPETADQVQTYSNNSWTVYWLHANSGSPKWVNRDDGTLADQAATVIPPGHAMFVRKCSGAAPVLTCGEVRENKFARPLCPGLNLVGGGYPVAQCAAGAGGRQMDLPHGFLGGPDPASADTFSLWKGDTAIGATGYDDFYLFDSGTLAMWVNSEDTTRTCRDAEKLFLGNRGAFINAKSALPAHTMPCPWASTPLIAQSAASNNWAQWQSVELAGETLNGPNDDPDHDGTPNLLEYVFGTPPLQSGAATATPVEVVTLAGQQFLQITIPRRTDRPATLSVQVSSDLTYWDEGPMFTEVVSNEAAALVVRDLTPLGAGVPRRFMRLHAELPAP